MGVKKCLKRVARLYTHFPARNFHECIENSFVTNYCNVYVAAFIQYVPINFGLRLHYYKNKEIFNCTYITLLESI